MELGLDEVSSHASQVGGTWAQVKSCLSLSLSFVSVSLEFLDHAWRDDYMAKNILGT